MRATKLNLDLGVPAPKEIYNFRVYALAVVSSMGAIIFGYDLGFIGTAITLPSFQRDFGLLGASDGKEASFSANVVSLLQAGCIVGALAAGPLSDKLGRLTALFFTTIFFNVGSIMQTASNGSWGLMYGGRVIGGVGVGAASMIVPLYVAETSPPLIRGRLVGMYEVGVSLGTLVGFWINYGISENLPATSKTWIISFAVQLIPGGLLMIGICFIPESPRWIARNKGHEACVTALQRLRNLPPDHPYLVEEARHITQSLALEEAITEGNNARAIVKEMFGPQNRRRLLTGVLMFVFMQMAGSNAINYYSPSIFKSIGVTGTNTGLFATGIYGAVRFVATMISMIFLVDRVGRTKLLMIGSAIMAFGMWFVGAYVKIAAPKPDASTQVSGGGIAAIVMIYIYAIGWCLSYAGIPWIFASEIFPLRVRSACISVCAATHWIMNFMIARSTPYMIKNIKYGTYFLFAACMTISIFWVYFFVPETKGVSLEDMDVVFGFRAPGEPLPVEKEDETDASHLERAGRTSSKASV